MNDELRIERQRPPEDADPDSPHYGCGWEYDHDAVVTYDGEDGVQWMCRRCDAEGWEPREHGEKD
jgi:hypothetical protein